MSYGDLFAGLLLIFALMLLTALYFYQSGVEGVREVLLVREEIVTELEETLGGTERTTVRVSPEGVLTFGDQVLFDHDSYQISPAGREQLSALVNQYLSIIFDNERFVERLERIVIEGHTNDIGEYFYNLNLSQNRAYAVMEVMIEEADEELVPVLKEKVTANGRSFSDLIFVDGDSTQVDREASRRIEVRFELDDQTLLQTLVDLVFQT